MCVCLFIHVFMETAVPFSYKAEVGAVKISEQEDEETGQGRPVGDLPLPSCQEQKSGGFNITLEPSKLKRISPLAQTSQSHFSVLVDLEFGSANLKLGIGFSCQSENWRWSPWATEWDTAWACGWGTVCLQYCTFSALFYFSLFLSTS